MKKRIIVCLFSIIVLCTIPITADAVGGYCVISGQNVYHGIFCSETWGYNIEDIKWYKTIKEVERTGYKPCDYCADSMFDYKEDGSTRWLSKDQKIQNALELERFMAVMDAVEVVEEECAAAYQEGYDCGKEAGYEDARYELEREYEEKLKEAKEASYKDGRNVALLLCVIFGIPVVCHFNTQRLEKEFDKREEKYFKRLHRLEPYANAIDILNIISRNTNTSIEELCKMLYISVRKASGKTETEAIKELESQMKKQ